MVHNASHVAGTPGGQHRFCFIFPMASGHINPSLPMARTLVEMGHEVHFLCREQMRAAIEDTGSVFHSDTKVESELYEGREIDYFGAMQSLKKEHGLEGASLMVSMTKLSPVMIELMMPGVLRWLRELQPKAVVYCPLMNQEAPLAAKVLGIPSVALLTTAGPGSMAKAISEFLEAEQLSVEQLEAMAVGYEPLEGATRRLQEAYGITVDSLGMFRPCGRLAMLSHSHVTLVTTCEDLQDQMEPDLEAAYVADGVAFAAVGPLLDKEGAKRAGGHKFSSDGNDQRCGSHQHRAASEEELRARLQAASAVGRPVVLASMGTVITGDSPDFGWNVRPCGLSGRRQGLTGRELCQASWGAAFDTFGSTAADEGALLVVSLGPQPDALEGLCPPPNAVCLPVVPQVDVLKAGVSVFLTHGGQNSFTEGLAAGVPLVVCPGFADQPVNARKAERLGVGLKVDRPVPPEGGEAAATAAYRAETAAALRRVAEEPTFRQAAQQCAERLRQAGGVPRAVHLVLQAAGLHKGAGAESPKAARASGAEAGAHEQTFQQALLAGA